MMIRTMQGNYITDESIQHMKEKHPFGMNIVMFYEHNYLHIQLNTKVICNTTPMGIVKLI